MIKVKVVDESATGKVFNEFDLEIKTKEISLREAIWLRIFHEVAEHNSQKPKYFNGLVQPTNAEETLNGYKLRNKRQIDAEQQYYTALELFQKNGFFVLIDDRQYTDLDEKVTLKQNSTFSFVKLIQLIGG